jgi:hypothetical protein
MKRSELKKQIEDAIVEILDEAEAYQVTSKTGKTTTQSFGTPGEADQFRRQNTNIAKVTKI